LNSQLFKGDANRLIENNKIGLDPDCHNVVLKSTKTQILLNKILFCGEDIKKRAFLR
jgi:hypothetical protein